MANIELGAFINGGAYSTVYAHPSDSTKVIMQGVYGDDLVKLGCYDALGYLYDLEIVDHKYTAIIEYMHDQTTSHHATIGITVACADDLYDDFYKSDLWQGVSGDRSPLLEEMATNPMFGDKVTKVCCFLMDNNITHFCFDNHTGNWMVDNEGDCLPMDVFNADYSCTDATTRDKINARITSK